MALNFGQLQPEYCAGCPHESACFSDPHATPQLPDRVRRDHKQYDRIMARRRERAARRMPAYRPIFRGPPDGIPTLTAAGLPQDSSSAFLLAIAQLHVDAQASLVGGGA